MAVGASGSGASSPFDASHLGRGHVITTKQEATKSFDKGQLERSYFRGQSAPGKHDKMASHQKVPGFAAHGDKENSHGQAPKPPAKDQGHPKGVGSSRSPKPHSKHSKPQDHSNKTESSEKSPKVSAHAEDNASPPHYGSVTNIHHHEVPPSAPINLVLFGDHNDDNGHGVTESDDDTSSNKSVRLSESSIESELVRNQNIDDVDLGHHFGGEADEYYSSQSMGEDEYWKNANSHEQNTSLDREARNERGPGGYYSHDGEMTPRETTSTGRELHYEEDPDHGENSDNGKSSSDEEGSDEEKDSDEEENRTNSSDEEDSDEEKDSDNRTNSSDEEGSDNGTDPTDEEGSDDE